MSTKRHIKKTAFNLSVSEYIAIFAVLINLVLAIFTYRLYKLSIYQAKIALNGVRTADSSIRLTKQIFEKENEPYLQVDEFSDIRCRDNRPFSTNFKVFNFGAQAVKLTKSAISFGYFKHALIDSLDLDKFQLDKVLLLDSVAYHSDFILSKDKAKKVFYYSFNKQPKGFAKNLLNGQFCIYIRGHLHYVNYITNKRKVYNFAIALVYIIDKFRPIYYESVNVDDTSPTFIQPNSKK